MRRPLTSTELGICEPVYKSDAPFFLGTVAGGIASGRVPADGHGNPVTSWVNPTSLLGGVLAVGVCAFVAAVFLTAEARTYADAGLERWFRGRAQASAVATGAVALAGIAILHADAGRLFSGTASTRRWPTRYSRTPASRSSSAVSGCPE
ncbi:cytochrome d ubiquinol oxidase subunit II [Micromonospora kangleipakensis]|uniref:cytochrome d ubiquinol oxidase subunit II n=1 Tax=Micromonospora kangleipakensis TaxID=1077942 RepID=UPI0010297B98|nr:cytochrome d ubiquinol oxidase subunit II [Micromonospora kangleipakensis]